MTGSERRLRFRPRAEVEAVEAAVWYEGRSPGLGSEFLRAIDAAFAAIQRNPAMYPIVHGRVRRHLLRRFPYGLFYVEYPTEVVILAIAHGRRHSRAWPSDPEA